MELRHYDVPSDRYIGDIVTPSIVKSGVCSMYFTVTLARLKIFNRYIGNIVISKNVISSLTVSAFYISFLRIL